MYEIDPGAQTPKQQPEKVAATTEEKTFEGLGISPQMLAILTEKKYTTPTPIQHQAIPLAVTGKDIVGIAQTGTGKTLAFGVPLIQRLGEIRKVTPGSIGLVILPTRELALQVEETFQKIGAKIGLRTAVLIGGEAFGRQIGQLQRRPHVIVATPGRLIDHLKQRTVDLSIVRVLVLDEADRMFDMGFEPQLTQILKSVSAERQTLLFSATMPAEIVTIATKHMKLPLRIEVAPAGTSAEKVEQEICIVKKEGKFAMLEKLLGEYKGTVLVFSRTKHQASKICAELRARGHNAAEIHSNRSLGQRRTALDGFKSGRFRVLVATDIAARGIDVRGIELVVNYDLPDASEDYVHRIGRTGRAGATGHAVSFALPSQRSDVAAIERLIRKSLPIAASSEKAEFDKSLGGSGGRVRSFGPSGFRRNRSGGGARGGFGGGSRGGFGGGRPSSGGAPRSAGGVSRGGATSESRPGFGSPRPQSDGGRRGGFGSAAAYRPNSNRRGGRSGNSFSDDDGGDDLNGRTNSNGGGFWMKSNGNNSRGRGGKRGGR